ncbi:MAG TPA: class I SAM-dependent methyltransferase [Thermoanaerobaculia bacterium]|nr:class I SAM-dependent methyltransferase [Thermoanaerobaculia bacterium]
MPAPFCTDPDCSLANSRVLLTGAAAYTRDGRSEQLPYELRLCDRCHLGFVHPVPAEDVLACFYASDYAYYQDAGRQPASEARSWKYRAAGLRYRALLAPGLRHRLAKGFAALVERLTRKTFTFTLGVPLALPKGSRILDYGYGTGSWLLSMRRRGYSALLGYDIAANTYRRDELAAQGLRIVPRLSDLADASLDCVRLEHVFEHLADPLAVLSSLMRKLRPGAFLVMTFPTIYPWLDVQDLASSPFLPHLQLPIHLAHHSLESSARLLRAAGFVDVVQRLTARERFITLMARRPLDGGS